MSVISATHLKKFYSVHQKKPGIAGTLSSFFARSYRNVKAVDDISFTIKEGELVGFIGPNGAGKTTTLKCLSGLILPTEGGVKVLGFTPFDKKRQFLCDIGLVMGQKNQLWWDLPPTETFLLLKEIYGIDTQAYEKNLSELVRLLDVGGILETPVRKLSLGQRMKCELIASLLHRPKILFLDEPTIGLDVVMQKTMREFIKEYNKRFKATILLTSHYMGDVEDLCKRVIIIDRGKIIYDGDLDKLIKKHAEQKIISVVFDKYVDPKKLASLATVDSFDFPKARLSVKRIEVRKVAAELLQNFPIDDIEITELEIENIIRNVFTSSRNA